MIKLEHDRTQLYQYDMNQRVIIEDIQPGTQVHFDTVPVTPYYEDGIAYADIPNELLQQSGPLSVYAYVFAEGKGYTKKTFCFSIKPRKKPDDYDANVMFSDTVDDILGEVVDGGLADKLSYLKECLDIMYQSPPIKLMREVFGENKSLKELCEYVGDLSDKVYTLVNGKRLLYKNEKSYSGYGEFTGPFISPDGTVLDYVSNGYIVPELYPLSDHNVCHVICAATSINYSGQLSLDEVSIVDLRGIKFEGETTTELLDGINEHQAYATFKLYCKSTRAIFLPKVTYLMSGTVFITGAKSVSNGIHLGTLLYGTSPEWIFKGEDIDPSSQIETPVYCDKDFYGDVYLEKLNIPSYCLIGIMENASYAIKGHGHDYSILSVGEYNINNLYAYLDELWGENFDAIQSVYSDYENDILTNEEALIKLKELCPEESIFFEFTELKGWKIQ